MGLPFFDKNVLGTRLDSCMSKATNIASVVASVNSVESISHGNLLRSYPKLVNYLLKKFTNNEAIGKMDSAFLCYAQPTNMTPTKYGDDLYAMSGKATDVFANSTLNYNFIEKVHSSICHSLHKYWDTHRHVDGTDFTFEKQLLIAI